MYRKKVLSGQETIHSRIGKKNQVKTAIDDIEEKLNEVSKKLDADEVDLRALQVSVFGIQGPPRTTLHDVRGDLICLRGHVCPDKIFMLGTFLSFYSF